MQKDAGNLARKCFIFNVAEKSAVTNVPSCSLIAVTVKHLTPRHHPHFIIHI